MRVGNGADAVGGAILPFSGRHAGVRKFHNPLAKWVVLGAYSLGNS